MESCFAAAFDATAHVLLAGGAAALPDEVEVGGDDGHHLARVRRVRVDETVTAADGRGHWRPYVVTGVGAGTLRLTATGPACVDPELSPRLRVAFAWTKGTKPELVVRQLTELGVDAILPVFAARTVGRRASAAGGDDARHDRLVRVVREAAIQCHRARLPELVAPGPLTALAGQPGVVVADRTGVGLAELAPAGPEGRLLVVGPEGGLAPEELEALVHAPRLGVGPHVLRAETAAVAAAAVLVAARADPRLEPMSGSGDRSGP